MSDTPVLLRKKHDIADRVISLIDRIEVLIDKVEGSELLKHRCPKCDGQGHYTVLQEHKLGHQIRHTTERKVACKLCRGTGVAA